MTNSVIICQTDLLKRDDSVCMFEEEMKTSNGCLIANPQQNIWQGYLGYELCLSISLSLSKRFVYTLGYN